MEIGQIIHNNPVGLACPDFVEALIVAIRSEIARVYWNVNQKAWKGAGRADIGGGVDEWSEEWKTLSYDTGIPGIEWRPYYNWGGSPDDADWNQTEADAPNFAFDGVEVRWYKHFGRSMNVNRDWAPERWVAWFNRCLDVVRLYEERRNEITHAQAIKKGNAPHRCPTCQRFFNWPAERCPYDGATLADYKLTVEEQAEQDRQQAEWQRRRRHGLPEDYRIIEVHERPRGWRVALVTTERGAMSMMIGKPFTEWMAVTLYPCGCISGSFGSSEEACRKHLHEMLEVERWNDERELEQAEARHAEGPF